MNGINPDILLLATTLLKSLNCTPAIQQQQHPLRPAGGWSAPSTSSCWTNNSNIFNRYHQFQPVEVIPQESARQLNFISHPLPQQIEMYNRQRGREWRPSPQYSSRETSQYHRRGRLHLEDIYYPNYEDSRHELFDEEAEYYQHSTYNNTRQFNNHNNSRFSGKMYPTKRKPVYNTVKIGENQFKNKNSAPQLTKNSPEISENASDLTVSSSREKNMSKCELLVETRDECNNETTTISVSAVTQMSRIEGENAGESPKGPICDFSNVETGQPVDSDQETICLDEIFHKIDTKRSFFPQNQNKDNYNVVSMDLESPDSPIKNVTVKRRILDSDDEQTASDLATKTKGKELLKKTAKRRILNSDNEETASDPAKKPKGKELLKETGKRRIHSDNEETATESAKKSKRKELFKEINSDDLLSQIEDVINEDKKIEKKNKKAAGMTRYRSKSLNSDCQDAPVNVKKTQSLNSLNTSKVFLNFDLKANLLALLSQGEDKTSKSSNKDNEDLLKILNDAKIGKNTSKSKLTVVKLKESGSTSDLLKILNDDGGKSQKNKEKKVKDGKTKEKGSTKKPDKPKKPEHSARRHSTENANKPKPKPTLERKPSTEQKTSKKPEKDRNPPKPEEKALVKLGDYVTELQDNPEIPEIKFPQLLQVSTKLKQTSYSKQDQRMMQIFGDSEDDELLPKILEKRHKLQKKRKDLREHRQSEIKRKKSLPLPPEPQPPVINLPKLKEAQISLVENNNDKETILLVLEELNLEHLHSWSIVEDFYNNESDLRLCSCPDKVTDSMEIIRVPPPEIKDEIIDLTEGDSDVKLEEETKEPLKLETDSGEKVTLYRSEETVNPSLEVQATEASLISKNVSGIDTLVQRRSSTSSEAIKPLLHAAQVSATVNLNEICARTIEAANYYQKLVELSKNEPKKEAVDKTKKILDGNLTVKIAPKPVVPEFSSQTTTVKILSTYTVPPPRFNSSSGEKAVPTPVPSPYSTNPSRNSVILPVPPPYPSNSSENTATVPVLPPFSSNSTGNAPVSVPPPFPSNSTGNATPRRVPPPFSSSSSGKSIPTPVLPPFPTPVIPTPAPAQLFNCGGTSPPKPVPPPTYTDFSNLNCLELMTSLYNQKLIITPIKAISVAQKIAPFIYCMTTLTVAQQEYRKVFQVTKFCPAFMDLELRRSFCEGKERNNFLANNFLRCLLELANSGEIRGSLTFEGYKLIMDSVLDILRKQFVMTNITKTWVYFSMDLLVSPCKEEYSKTFFLNGFREFTETSYQGLSERRKNRTSEKIPVAMMNEIKKQVQQYSDINERQTKLFKEKQDFTRLKANLKRMQNNLRTNRNPLQSYPTTTANPHLNQSYYSTTAASSSSTTILSENSTKNYPITAAILTNNNVSVSQSFNSSTTSASSVANNQSTASNNPIMNLNYYANSNRNELATSVQQNYCNSSTVPSSVGLSYPTSSYYTSTNIGSVFTSSAGNPPNQSCQISAQPANQFTDNFRIRLPLSKPYNEVVESAANQNQQFPVVSESSNSNLIVLVDNIDNDNTSQEIPAAESSAANLNSDIPPPLVGLPTEIKNEAVKCETTMPSNFSDEVIDLTWMDDLDPEVIESEMQMLPVKDELVSFVEVFPEENVDEANNEFVAPSPADSGISSPPLQVEMNEILLRDRLCCCGKDAEYLCDCRCAMYCSRNCQLSDWSLHKAACLKYQAQNKVAVTNSSEK